MELKSGKIPNVRYMVNVNGKNVQNDVWLEHIYQVTGYDILMNYIAPDINLNSCIIYIQDTNKPVRVIVIENFIKSRFINFRNWIAALDYKLRNGEFKVIEKIMEFPSIPAFNHLSPFAKDDIILFNKTYLRSSDLLKEWFKVCSKFISNEIYFSKIGNSESNQYSNSSFWKDELNVKLENRIILTDLNLNVLESDFQNMHLVFIRNKPEQKSVFRIGDIVLVYPENNQFNPTKNIIYKAYIKLINKKSIFISLRNKKVNKSRFLISDNWNLELDISDNNTKNQYSSIFELLLAPADKTAILLGISNQEMDNLEYHPELKLNSKQTELFNASINAKNYFLIQGPPGTGKTSYMLAALVLYYFGSTNKQLLITAYTNRAVEEIFESINKYISNDNILRVGTKTGNSSDKILLSILSESLTIKELQKRIDNTRIVISTISSLNTNKEIFQLKNFDIAIVDEASQILEPQIIGILTQVSKFILIGDEKQLPAVTLQKPSDLTINNDKLNEIELYNLGDSYFARMLKICEKNRWYKCFGSLNEQARMHKEIQDFPNIYFYNNILQTICDEQQHGSRLFQENNNSSLEQFLSGYRVCFIDCPIEYENKISFTESTIVKKIINIINHNKPIIHKYNVGVISPFKLQCNNISMELSEELRELVTVDTVERYQGSQRDIIIISMAVNSKSLLDRTISESNNSNIDRKLNVAITRAKEHLIMVGNSEILVLSENYKNFINYCKSKNSYSKLDQFIN